jgi:hypothetical protein
MPQNVNLQFIGEARACARFDSKRSALRGTMIRRFAIALALTFTTSLIVQVVAVSQASAGKPCTYTSSDKKKGYKC